MLTVNGKWKWNDNAFLDRTNISQLVNFVSNGESFINISYSADGLNPAPDVPRYVKYSKVGAVDVTAATSNSFEQTIFWHNDNYKVVDFGTESQKVSQNFYSYLTANATVYTEPEPEPSTVKTVSSDNLAEFKAMCDETYAAIGNIPTVSTELVNLGTLSTSGTLTTDQVTQIGTTTVGVTARASVNGVTRFYERVNISGTTATLVSADDDALHVLAVNLSTRAYTLSDVALGGGGPEIPTPTASDNGKVLGVSNGAYALQEASGGGTKLYRHELSTDQDGAYSQYMYVFSPTQTQYSSFADAFQDYHAISYKGVIQLREDSGVSVSYKSAVILGFNTETSKAILYDTKENVIISMTGAEIDANVSWMGDGVWDIDKP